MNRRTAREKAMQILFQLEVNDIDPAQAIENFIGSTEGSDFFTKLIEGVIEYNKEIEEIISSNLENWTIDRVASVEKVILRIATYEITYLEDIPKSVSINEAVELAKKFGDEKSGKFVNGVLSKIID